MKKYTVEFSILVEVEGTTPQTAIKAAVEELNKKIETGQFFVGDMDAEARQTD